MNCGICNEPTDLWEDCGVICKDCADKPRHRYYASLRPPSWAAIPDGWCLRRFQVPKGPIPGTGFFAHGWVEYAEPLPFEKAWRFDLVPADKDEQERYNEWYKENRQ